MNMLFDISHETQTPALRKAPARLSVLAALFVLILAATVLCAPSPAHASYADAAGADEYSTVADLVPKSGRIDADDIPAGSYTGIEVDSSSKFCKVTNCTVKKTGDRLLATFTLTKTYNAIYVGKSEQAITKTDASGTDDSAYTLGKLVDIDGTALHQFTLELPAVNVVAEIATFNGGKAAGIKAGSWYDRYFVFNATDELIMAVEAKKAGADDSGKDGKDNEGEKTSSGAAGTKDDSGKKDGGASDKNDADDSTSKAGAAAGGKASEDAKGTGTKAKGSNAGSATGGSSDSAKAAPAKSAASVTKRSFGGTSKTGTRDSGAGVEDSDSSDDESDASEAAKGKAQDGNSNTKSGIGLSFASAELEPDVENAAVLEGRDAERSPFVVDNAVLLAAALAIALALLGALMHIVWFKRAGGSFVSTRQLRS